MIEIPKTFGTEEKTAEAAGETFVFGPTHASIRYPSYVSLDHVIDVDRLIALDDYLTEKIRARISDASDKKFYTGPYRLARSSSDRPGSKMIYLANSRLPDNYFDLDRAELWETTDDAQEFSRLMDFIGTLPFEVCGRMLIMYDENGGEIPAHRDHVETDVLHEFLWLRTNKKKQLYVLNATNGEKLYVSSYAAWFDTVNQFHGCDASDGLSFSIRIDGRFTEEFRASIPRPSFNAASTPAFWAAAFDQREG